MSKKNVVVESEVVENEVVESNVNESEVVYLELIEKLNEELVEVKKLNKELRKEVERLKEGGGRKVEFLEILRRHGRITIADIAKEMNTTAKNVSSIKSAVKDMGIRMGKDSLNRIFEETD
jgi:hypothetical protein